MATPLDFDQVTQCIVDSLKKERLRQQLSLNKLSQSAGLSHTMVMRVEKRERLPTIDTLLRIAAVLDVDLGEIISDASTGRRRKGQ